MDQLKVLICKDHQLRKVALILKEDREVQEDNKLKLEVSFMRFTEEVCQYKAMVLESMPMEKVS